MNIDRGKESFTQEEVDRLRDELKVYKDEAEIGWSPLADRVGDVGASSLSAWVNGTYAGDMKNIAWKVNRFFLAEEARREMALQAPIVPTFKVTPTARQMLAQLQFARQGNFVVITGHPGVGKTAVFDQFCGQTPNAFKATMSPATKSLTSMLLAILKASGSTSSYGGRAMHLLQAIIDRLKGMSAVMIIDEAQHLDDESIEQLRAIQDALKCGLCLAGNPEVMRRVQRGANTAAFAQLASRVAWPAHYERPTDADIDVILAAWGVQRESQIRFLRQVSAAGGGLRSITQVLTMATLTARATDEEVTLGHLQAAQQQRATPQMAA